MINDLMIKVGGNLKELRKINNYTQNEIANYLNIDQGHLSNIERGKRTLSSGKLKKLCDLYNCEEEYILSEIKTYTPPKIAFHGKQEKNLELVAKMNEIMKNLKELRNDTNTKTDKPYEIKNYNPKISSEIFRNRLNLSTNPIDIIPLVLEHFKNLTIIWMPFEEKINGCCSKSENDWLIIINSNLNQGKQNFTLAHELYHLIFESSNRWNICGEFESNNVSEKNANEFAFNLLLPYYAIDQYIIRNNIEKWTSDNLIQCEHYFKINHESLICRLKKYNLIKEIDDTNNETLIIKSKKLGLESQLYEKNTKNKEYYSLGAYIPLIEKAYEENKISHGKKEELLITAYRSDIIYNL